MAGTDRNLGAGLADTAAEGAASKEEIVAEDGDLSLARLLQEQERAFLLLSGRGRGSGGDYDGGFGSLASSMDGFEEEEDLDDEEVARRMQREEDRRRLAGLIQAQLRAEGRADEDEGAGGSVERRSGSERLGDERGEPHDIDTMTYEELTALGEVVGTESKGMAEGKILQLPEKTFAECKACRANTSSQSGEGGLVSGKQGMTTSHQQGLVRGVEAGEEEEEQCVICRVEFEEKELVKVLPCGHCYHSPCIMEWLKINRACPICNHEVVKDREEASSLP